jgi:hypothetical protein
VQASSLRSPDKSLASAGAMEIIPFPIPNAGVAQW